MLIENLLERNDVINLAMNYSLNNNLIDFNSYKSQTKQSEEIIEIVKKKFPNFKMNNKQDIRIIATKSPFSNKEIVIPSRSIFCDHLDCVNFTEMFSHISLVKKCPMCKINCEIKDILIDSYLYDIFQVLKSNPSMKNAEFLCIILNDLLWEIIE